MRKKRWMMWLGGVVLLAIIVLGVVFFQYGRAQQTLAEGDIHYRTVTVESGTISSEINGSGSVQPAQSETLSAGQNATVKHILVEAGQHVEAGFRLIEFSGQDMQPMIDDEKARLSSLEAQLTELEQQKQKTSTPSSSTEMVLSPGAGDVRTIFVQPGERVNAGDRFMVLRSKEGSTIELLFTQADVARLNMGDPVLLTLEGTDKTLTGQIRAIDVDWQVSGDKLTQRVIIAVKEPIATGVRAEGTVQKNNEVMQSVSAGVFQAAPDIDVRFQKSGEVESISVQVGQVIKRGDTLGKLKITSASSAGESASTGGALGSGAAVTSAAMTGTSTTGTATTGTATTGTATTGSGSGSTEEQLKRQIQDSQDRIAQYEKQAEPPAPIVAPFSGVIQSISVKEGDVVHAGQELITLVDDEMYELVVPVDELDVPKIHPGQDALIQVNALPDKIISGTVEKVANRGTVNGGMASFDVSIRFSKVEGLLSGMTASAVIELARHDQALLVPIEAVQKRGNQSFVLVKGAQTPLESQSPSQDQSSIGSSAQPVDQSPAQSSAQTTASSPDSQNSSGNPFRLFGTQVALPSDASIRPVKVGLVNNTMAEITYGLQEGETIYVPEWTVQATSDNGTVRPGGSSMMGIPGGTPGGRMNFGGGGGFGGRSSEGMFQGTNRSDGNPNRGASGTGGQRFPDTGGGGQ